MYIYMSCNGDIFGTEEPVEERNQCCSLCGGYTELLGEAETEEETMKLFNEDDWIIENIRQDVKRIFKLQKG